MPAAQGEATKSPKTPRRLRSGDSLNARQVRFEAERDEASTKDRQPTSFPQVGPAPVSGAAQGWHTAADPTRSLGSVATGPAATPHFFNTAANQHHHPPHFAPNVTFIGQPQPVMPDYSNTAPHPVGFNFQPPVPDTTFGPMSHLFVPRFDAVPTPSPAGPHGIVPGAYPAGPPGYVFAPQAYAAQQQQQQQQPIMINGQAYVPVAAAPGQPYPPQMMPGGYAMVNGAPVPVMTPGNENKLPDVSGMSRTPNEEMLRQIQFAHENKLFEPQDFKPGDDDPSRFYYVRELDGNWTQRNRYTIDSLACRWYVTDEGWFYAVRLPD